MNLLNSIFNSDEIIINCVNKKYFIIFIIIFILLLASFFINKDKYYTNTYSVINDKIVLIVDKDNINNIKNSKNIVISNINSNYSINSIVPINGMYMVYINLKSNIKNINQGTYRILLGKERLFETIIRIIKK